MSKARVYLRNIAANWVGYGASLIVVFFMSPFVVHSLGDVQYGLWSLLTALTGYLGLVEVGTRAGLGRYVTYYLGRGDNAKVNGIFNTALAMFVVIGVLVLAVAGVVSLFLLSIFPKIPTELADTAKAVMLLAALNLWLALVCAGFTAILRAHERFDLTNVMDLVVLLVRTAGAVALLSSGGGLVGLALIQIGASLLGLALGYVMAKRVFPDLRIGPQKASFTRLRELLGFSLWAFIGRISVQLVTTTDMVVIAIILGPGIVTYYAIGSMLVERACMLVSGGASVFAPQIVKSCATENWEELRQDYGQGVRVTLAIAVPLVVGMLVASGLIVDGLRAGGLVLVVRHGRYSLSCG